MKISISTLGCPEWTFEEIVDRVSAYGYDGIEFRGIGPDLDLSGAPGFETSAGRKARLRRITDAGLAVVAVDSSTRLTDIDPKALRSNLDHARATIDLAADLGAPFVRVFGGDIPEGEDRDITTARVADGLRDLGDYASQHGDVIVALETHDGFSRGDQVAKVLTLVPHPRVAALWDLHHPYRHNEAPEDTMRSLDGRVAFAHVKDSKPGGTYCLPGDGDIPLKPMIDLLREHGYDGWLSLEWEKRWAPGLLPPETAFPAYAQFLRDVID